MCKSPTDAVSPAQAGGQPRRRRLQPAAWSLLIALLIPLFALHPAAAQESAKDPESAVKISQAAIGTQLGDYTFTASDGRKIRLADLRGTPLALTFIYTACAETCPTLITTLADVADDVWSALGQGSFKLLTVGFNAPADSPNAMRLFAAQRGVKNRDWLFLAGDLPSIAGLAQDTGFVFFDSAKGFDHLAQVTLIDRDGVVRAQVYGDTFDLANFMEPMKAVVSGGPVISAGALWERVRLFCTVYDARSGKYYFNYSFFIEIFAGITVLAPVAWFLLKNWRSSGRTGPRI